MAYITFERFGKKEQWEGDKEIFLDELRLLMTRITKNENSSKDIKEKINIINPDINKNEKGKGKNCRKI